MIEKPPDKQKKPSKLNRLGQSRPFSNTIPYNSPFTPPLSETGQIEQRGKLNTQTDIICW
jgi:hypothetical protein